MLNSETINKIAAGEVITRPVSIVKELVENAMDAGATRIRIAITQGGKEQIVITDNGCGIPYNEVPLAFQRHATSKIAFIEDLETIETLGFRGEALSSIAAVAKVKITTKFEKEEMGSQAYFSESQCDNQRVCVYGGGTEIVVSDLFYNTPARKKHLQKSKNEEAIVRDIVVKLVLSHPEVAFIYVVNGKTIFQTPGTNDLKSVVEAVFGRQYCKSLREVDVDNAPMHISGLISDLTLTQKTREQQIFFVNGRYIKNTALSNALESAYEGYLMQHRHPVSILFITLPGRMLDVNIHPAKTEIQILNESLVSMLFKQGIRQTLKEQNLMVEPMKMVETLSEEVDQNERNEQAKQLENVNFLADLEPAQKKEPPKEVPPFTHFQEKDQPNAFLEEKPKDRLFQKNANPEMLSSSPKKTDDLSQSREKIREETGTYERSAKNALQLKHARIVGQLFYTYILLEKEHDLYLIDQHAAHEAFWYEAFTKKLRKNDQFSAQNLLVPQTIEISVKEAAVFDQIQPVLKRFGFNCALRENQTIDVQSVPIILGEPQDLSLLKHLIEAKVYEDVEMPKAEVLKLASMACKKAVKGNQILRQAEIEQLIEDLQKMENPFTCPHGRPVIMHLKEYDLEKLFKRVV